MILGIFQLYSSMREIIKLRKKFIIFKFLLYVFVLNYILRDVCLQIHDVHNAYATDLAGEGMPLRRETYTADV